MVSRHSNLDNPNGLWQPQLSVGLPFRHQKGMGTRREELESDVQFP